MSIIAKQITNQPIIDSDIYELYVNETVKDINDNDVVIPKSIGRYSIADLNNQKNYFTSEITKIDEKLAAIGNI